MIKRIILFSFTLTLLACSSVSEVIKLGNNTYTVSSSMSGNFPAWSEVKQLALKNAVTKCESMNKYTEVVKYDTHGARGWSPLNVELTFKCLKEKSENKN